jgi:hypothetical protein
MRRERGPYKADVRDRYVVWYGLDPEARKALGLVD